MPSPAPTAAVTSKTRISGRRLLRALCDANVRVGSAAIAGPGRLLAAAEPADMTNEQTDLGGGKGGAVRWHTRAATENGAAGMNRIVQPVIAARGHHTRIRVTRGRTIQVRSVPAIAASGNAMTGGAVFTVQLLGG